MKKIFLCFSCVLFLMVFSCKEDDTTIIPEEQPVAPVNFEENFGSTISARFIGRVFDENKMPVQGAIIQIGNSAATTDLFGTFSITDATVFEKFAYVQVSKEGYIQGSRALIPSTTEVNRVEIMLLKEDVIATINSGQNATVNLSNGTEVTFDGNFVKSSGEPHSGEVKVILKHLSPDDENMEAMMPGMLLAQNETGAAVSLETYGMIAVELKSSGGETLQLAEGSTSQITMPISATATNPPTTMPLWHFDETLGYWIEEGEATLQGNTYVGEVSHFSFWNYDYPYPAVTLCITLVDENEIPLPYTNLQIYSSLLNTTGTYGYTDASGVECGWVPADEQLTVTVQSPFCPNESFSTTIGPFTNDSNVVIPVVSGLQTTTITGTFVNCDGNNITDGYVQLFVDGNSTIIPVTDGTVNYTLTYCGTIDFSIKGIDITNNQVTDVVAGTLNGNATFDIGALSSCIGFVDSDGDGVFDTFEDINNDNDLSNDDTDNDGVPNYLDTDDDGDGIPTANETYDGDNDPTNDDTDGDQIPDYLDALDVVIFDAEVQGDGCDPLVFDLSILVQNTHPNMSYEFYETEADAIAATNPLGTTYQVPFANYVAGSNIYIKGTNTITNATAIALVYLYVQTSDTDNDGLTDCEEITGIDDPATNAVPSGTSDPNDPNDPVPTVTLVTENISVTEDVGIATVNFSLSAAQNQDVNALVYTTAASALAPDDYISVSTVITIPAGDTSASVQVTIIDDGTPEPVEEFIIQAQVTSNNTVNTVAVGSVTILDNDGSGGFPAQGIIEACDDNFDGIVVVDLAMMDAYFLNGNTGTISYHASLSEANANVNPLPTVVSATDGQIFYARIDSDLGILQVSSLTVVAFPIPQTPSGLTITECDGNNDGVATFNFSQISTQITQNQTGLIVTFHTTQFDADASVNALPNTYTNTATVETIFYRVEDMQTGCYAIGTIDLIVDSGC